MTLKQVFKAQESLIKYIEDGRCMSSEQAIEACKEIERLRKKTNDDVVFAALLCLESTLYSIYTDRKPEP